MKKFYFFLTGLLILVLSFGGCSSSIKTSSENSDPFESTNRNIFHFNKYFDKEVISPISRKYVKNVPDKTRKSISSHLDWIGLPTTIFNSTLQMDPENTILASVKFMLNGLTLGFFDLDNGETIIDKKDFGSSLAKLNVPEGPFLMVPFIGPKFTRDLSGAIIDNQTMADVSSSSLNDVKSAEVPVNIIDKNGKFSQAINRVYNSPDPYIKMRSYYIQNRRNKVYSEKYHENKNKDKDEEFEKLLQ